MGGGDWSEDTCKEHFRQTASDTGKTPKRSGKERSRRCLLVYGLRASLSPSTAVQGLLHPEKCRQKFALSGGAERDEGHHSAKLHGV